MRQWIGACSRFAKILWIAVKHGLRHDRAIPRPARLRLAFEELGPTFIKLGQFLATRADFLPEYTRELSRLLDRVPPCSWSAAREVIRRELGAYPEDLFQLFPETPVASASLAQVYAAVLKSGERVAVKVQRPGIASVIEQDLRIFTFLTRILDALRVMGPIKITPYVREFAATVREELNFEFEAYNAQRLGENAAGNPAEKIPKVYQAYTTGRILTTEYLEGIWLNDLIQMLNSNDAVTIHALEALGIDRLAVARHIYHNSMIQLCETGFFHVDLHPANIIVMGNDLIGYVDFGVVGSVDEVFRTHMLQYLESASKGDYERAADLFLSLAIPQEGADIDGFRSDYKAELIRYHNSMRKDRSTLRAKSMGSYLARHMLSARKHGISFPSRSLSFSRTLVTLDIIILQLAPEVDMLDLFSEFFKEARVRTLVRGLSVFWDSGKFMSLLESLPRMPEQFLARIREDGGGHQAAGFAGPDLRPVRRRGGQSVVGLLVICWAVLLSAVGDGALLRTSPSKEIILSAFAAVSAGILLFSRKP